MLLSISKMISALSFLFVFSVFCLVQVHLHPILCNYVGPDVQSTRIWSRTFPQQKGCSQWLPDSTYFRYPYPTDLVFHVEDYKHDNGAGPRGQLAVHPAIAQFILDNAPWELWTPLKTDLSKQNNRFPLPQVSGEVGLISCVSSSGSIKVVMKRAHQSCWMWRMWCPDGSPTLKEIGHLGWIWNYAHIPPLQAANIPGRQCEAWWWHQCLGRSAPTGQWVGTGKWLFENLGQEKMDAEIRDCVCKEYFMLCREMGNRRIDTACFSCLGREFCPKEL